MTVVRVTESNDRSEVECVGHSGYAEVGSDIVCAAVSAIVQTAALGWMKYAKNGFFMERSDGYVRFSVSGLTDVQRHDCEVVLETMKLGIGDLQTGYSDFIQLEVK